MAKSGEDYPPALGQKAISPQVDKGMREQAKKERKGRKRS